MSETALPPAGAELVIEAAKNLGIKSAPDVPQDGPRCPRCGDLLPAGTQRCGSCGVFLPGNAAAKTHGIYAKQPSDLRMSADDLMSGIIADRGGEDELSTLEKSYVRKIADVDVICRLLANDIARNGLMTASGARVRESFDKLMTGLATFDRYAQRLGLQRKPRPVKSLADVLREAQ